MLQRGTSKVTVLCATVALMGVAAPLASAAEQSEPDGPGKLGLTLLDGGYYDHYNGICRPY